MTAPILFTQVFAVFVGGALEGGPFLLGATLLVGSLVLTARAGAVAPARPVGAT